MPEPLTAFGFHEGDDASGTIGEFECVATITEVNWEDGVLTELGVNFTADCPCCGYTFEEDFYSHSPEEFELDSELAYELVE